MSATTIFYSDPVQKLEKLEKKENYEKLEKKENYEKLEKKENYESRLTQNKDTIK
jgi:hypothetical protein